MKERIRQYVDGLFEDIYETKQLRELKEEISANMLEKINDFLAGGDTGDKAFEKAVSELGDMSELIAGLKKASDEKSFENAYTRLQIDKKHVIGYTAASALTLLGLMTGGLSYLQQNKLLVSISYLIPFILVAAPLFVYFGLTQETRHNYGMKGKRALTYCIASEILLFGISASEIEYLQEKDLRTVLFTLIPFIVVSAVIFIYLGLTEKSRRKMGPEWERQWVQYYSDPQSMMLMGGISGALWIFSIAAFFFIGFTWGWKYSWIVFVFAIGCEPLLAAIFSGGNKKK